MVEEELSRRQFLKVSAALALGALASAVVAESVSRQKEFKINPEILEKINKESTEIKSLASAIAHQVASDYGFSLPPPKNEEIYFPADFAKDILSSSRRFMVYNPEVLPFWLDGNLNLPAEEVLKKPPLIRPAEEFLNRSQDELLNHQSLENKIRWLLGFLVKDQGRISEIIYGDSNCADSYNGRLYWYQSPPPAGKEFKLTSDLNSLPCFIHELTHLLKPDLRFQPEGFLTSLSGTWPQIAEFNLMWLRTIENQLPFFKARFFEQEGDWTLNIIKNEGIGGVLNAQSEFIAMLCPDFLLRNIGFFYNKENLPDSFLPWPQEVEKAVAITWNWLVFGPRGKPEPIHPLTMQAIGTTIKGELQRELETH